MPLGTLDRTPPPFFRQGASALSKLMVCSAPAVVRAVADQPLPGAPPVLANRTPIHHPNILMPTGHTTRTTPWKPS